MNQESVWRDGGHWSLIIACQLVLVASFFALWEISSRAGWVDSELIPPLSQVLAALFGLLQQPSFRTDVWVTVLEIGTAFTGTVLVGIPLGLYLGERPGSSKIVEPILQFLVAVPKVILLPIFILAFGIGFLERTLFAGTIGIFVAVLSGMTAVRAVPQGLVIAARSFGATPLQLYTHIYVPAMLPLIVSGIRISLILVIFGVILSEMYASSNGLGRLIFVWGEAYRMTPLLAGVLVTVVFALIPNELLRILENSLLRRQGR